MDKFQCVVENGSFSLTAKEASSSQATVSKTGQRILSNLIARYVAKITELGDFILQSVTDIARYDKFGASADRTPVMATVMRLLPRDGAEYQYHIQLVTDGLLRRAQESQLRPT